MKPAETRISSYNYPLPEERIAQFPLARRDDSKLLLYRHGEITESRFGAIGEALPAGSMLVFNNTKVIRARLFFFKESGARIEIFCLEPSEPADYERAFATVGRCRWQCIVGNLKKWKAGELHIDFMPGGAPCRLSARRVVGEGDKQIIEFKWDNNLTFGQLLEVLGKIPIPPYLGRDSQESDNQRYQTVYAQWEGSVAAPTAGLHFTPELIEQLHAQGHPTGAVTLHVGAGTFLPVKTEGVTDHQMHTEHFEIGIDTLSDLLSNFNNITAVGTTTVRTIESLCALGFRILQNGDPDPGCPVGQWELYDIPEAYDGRILLEALALYLRQNNLASLKAATRILIMPEYRFRVVNHLITNFHQPKSTLLLLVSAFVGEDWHRIYAYALEHDFRFLSYGDSSLLIR